MSRPRATDDPNTKSKAEMIEGPEAFTRFDALVRSVISVPHSVIVEREAEYKKQAALNPRKRGPKPKRKSANQKAGRKGPIL